MKYFTIRGAKHSNHNTTSHNLLDINFQSLNHSIIEYCENNEYITRFSINSKILKYPHRFKFYIFNYIT